MSEEVDTQARAKAAGLGDTVARVAVVVRESHKHQPEITRTAVTQVYRPWWSKFEPETWSMGGGKVEDVDLPAERDYTEADFQHVAAQTAIRELRSELNIQIAIEDLTYVGVFDNGQVVTALFYVLADDRPEITVNTKEIDGYRWKGIEAAAVDEETFADHGPMYRAIIDDLAKAA